MRPMPLHLIKLCVGADSLDDLRQWMAERMREAERSGAPPRHAHVTRMTPKRAGEILGYAGAWIVLDEAHITNIAVQAAARGRGVGTALTQGLLQYAANLGVVYATLEVRRSNLIAQSLYKQFGFFYAGLRKRYYEDNGEDAFIFCCQQLPPAEPDFTEPETVTEG